ncbi:hypothetical protein RHGRI_018515 [Rhododendron griersonianum]|uniref:Uncharacterized protein n=1 Tax=Rhododendron griersonianum TaxID=479676 RepID=A0AAV6K1P2_9ERIC|nr:hypothetical protein RHGRI_018515 [Rhododendron griersonianum]
MNSCVLAFNHYTNTTTTTTPTTIPPPSPPPLHRHHHHHHFTATTTTTLPPSPPLYHHHFYHSTTTTTTAAAITPTTTSTIPPPPSPLHHHFTTTTTTPQLPPPPLPLHHHHYTTTTTLLSLHHHHYHIAAAAAATMSPLHNYHSIDTTYCHHYTIITQPPPPPFTATITPPPLHHHHYRHRSNTTTTTNTPPPQSQFHVYYKYISTIRDFLDDVLEEESDKIFFDNNTSSFQSEIDWASPPRFDEYVDDEYGDDELEICETNVIEDIVHVAIQEDGIIGKIIDGSGETKFIRGDFLDDVLEEESDKIFFDNNTSSFQSEIDWASPPRFDEYVDDEYADDELEICETNVIEDIVHVAIQEDGIIGKIIDGSGETKFMSLDSSSSIDRSFATWKFADWVDKLEIDWESPPKFDEYPDEEEVVIHEVEENVKDEPMEEIIAEENIVPVAGKIARAEPMLVDQDDSSNFLTDFNINDLLISDVLNDKFHQEGNDSDFRLSGFEDLQRNSTDEIIMRESWKGGDHPLQPQEALELKTLASFFESEEEWTTG